MARLQVNEMITLAATVLLVPFVLASLRELPRSTRRFILGTYAALLLSQVATNVEALLLPGVFNLLEHASTAVASIFFALIVLSLSWSRPEGGAGQ